MGIYITMKDEEIQEHKNFVIYNYIASQKNITQQQLQEDLRWKYGLEFDKKQVQEIILDYVRSGILSPRLRSYEVNKI